MHRFEDDLTTTEQIFRRWDLKERDHNNRMGKKLKISDKLLTAENKEDSYIPESQFDDPDQLLDKTEAEHIKPNQDYEHDLLDNGPPDCDGIGSVYYPALTEALDKEEETRIFIE